MNQDFTVQKKQYLSEKKFVQRGSPEKKKKNSCTSGEREKKSYKLKIPHPPPPHHFSNGPSLMMKLSSTYTQYFSILMFYAALKY